MFIFSTRIFYRGVPDFAADCPCGVLCRGSTTCFLYVGTPFGNLVCKDGGFVSLTYIMENNFFIVSDKGLYIS